MHTVLQRASLVKLGPSGALPVRTTRSGCESCARRDLSETNELPEWMRVEEILQFARPFYPGWDDGYARSLCAVNSAVSGPGDNWMAQHAAWRAEYGVAATVGFAALTPVAVVLLTLSATASATWIVLTGRSNITLPWAFCIISGFCLLAPRVGHAGVATLLDVIIPSAAVVKICRLMALLYYVGSRRVLSWRRLAAITAFWAGTAGTVVSWISWNAAQSPITPTGALRIGILAAPVLGASSLLRWC